MFNKKFASLALAGMVGLGFRLPSAEDIENFIEHPQVPQAEAASNIRNQNTNSDRNSGKGSDIRNTETGKPNILSRFINRKGVLGSATVTAKSGTSLTVTQGDKTYTILTSGDTQYRRKFWGTSSFDEISVGDKINVVGKWNNDARTEINALWIRDLSILKRSGVFFGEVKSLSGSGFVMTMDKKGDQTVTVGSAKLVNREQVAISLSDIKVGDKVRVKGTWDSLNKTITEVSQVKDFSIPVKVKETETPTPTP